MTHSPTFPDRPVEPVGVILARWRKRRGLTGQALGDRVRMSQAKISRIETGAATAEPHDVRLLAEALDMPLAETEHLVGLAEHADNQLTEWISSGHDLTARQHEYGRMEAAAKELRVLQPAVIPGLLQTSAYARALLTDLTDETGDAEASSAAVAEAVNARMQRNEILHSRDRAFYFLITEQVLRTHPCKPAEMWAQIDRMREVAAFPAVHLGIITDDAPVPIVPYHGFVVADDRWVSVDLFNASLRSGGRKTVRAYRRVFEALERVALTDVDDLLDRYQSRYAQMLVRNSVAG